MTHGQIWFIIWLTSAPLGAIVVWLLDTMFGDVERKSFPSYLKWIEDEVVKSIMEDNPTSNINIVRKYARAYTFGILVIPLICWIALISNVVDLIKTHKGS